MKNLTTLIFLCSLGVSAWAQTSAGLVSSCRDDVAGTVTISWDGTLNSCVVAGGEGDASAQGWATLGLHSAAVDANDVGTWVNWDAVGAVSATQDAGEATRYNATLDIAAYYGVDYCDTRNIQLLFNSGANATDGNPWDTAGRSEVAGGFGCNDMVLYLDDVPQCSAPPCNSANAPACVKATPGPTKVDLSWLPISGSVACQVKGNRYGIVPFNPTQNIIGAEPKGSSVPYAVMVPGEIWDYSVRCACSITPIDASSFSAPSNTWTVPSPRLAGSEINVFAHPNPAFSELVVSFETLTEGEVVFHVLDIQGRILSVQRAEFAVGINQHVIDVRNLENGTYFFRQEGSQMKDAMTFVVQH